MEEKIDLCKNGDEIRWFDGTILWLLCDFLSLKNDVNVVLKSNKKKKLISSCHLEGHWQK